MGSLTVSRKYSTLLVTATGQCKHDIDISRQRVLHVDRGEAKQKNIGEVMSIDMSQGQRVMYQHKQNTQDDGRDVRV